MPEANHNRLGERYVLRYELGRGAFGSVYAATDLLEQREVAIKFFTPGDTESAATEAKNARQIQHPNVVPVVDVGQHGGTPYLVMPLIHGRTLDDHLHHSIALRRAIELLADVAAGLDALHHMGFVHGDLKPSNIMITEGPAESAVLVDVDISTAAKEGFDGPFIGTRAYAAPEHLARHQVTPAADVYSLAVVLFQCITGMLPSPRRLPVLDTGTTLDQALQPVLHRGLDTDPSHRYESASELINAALSRLDEIDPQLADRPSIHAMRPPVRAPTTVRE